MFSFSSKNTRRPYVRQGTVIVLSSVLMVVLMALLALALDIGCLSVARSELQRATDSAVLAGAGLLLSDDRLRNAGDDDILAEPDLELVRSTCQEFVNLNDVMGKIVQLNNNAENSSTGEVVVGTYTNPGDQTETLATHDPTRYNAVLVRKEMPIRLFFARAIGQADTDVNVVSAAAVFPGVSGFRLDDQQGTLDVLPITLKRSTWINYLASNSGQDQYAFDEESGTAGSGPDGIPELLLYPNGTTSGNFGTVDIGDHANSTADFVRQVRYGLNHDDLTPYGGRLALNSSGKLNLNGETGISAGIKAALEEIVGRKKIIPIYDTVVNNGDRTDYTIVGFVGVRLMHVNLSGGHKGVVVQKTNVMSKYALVDTSLNLANNLVYTTPRLVR